jgi:hypothetical protein
MLAAGRDLQLVRRVPASLKAGQLRLATLGCAQVAIPPPRAEAAPFALCACGGGVGSQRAVAPPNCTSSLPRMASCTCLLLLPRAARVMITCWPELALMPPAVDLAQGGRQPPLGADASYSQLKRTTRGRALTKPCWLPCATSSLYSVPLPLRARVTIVWQP